MMFAASVVNMAYAGISCYQGISADCSIPACAGAALPGPPGCCNVVRRLERVLFGRFAAGGVVLGRVLLLVFVVYRHAALRRGVPQLVLGICAPLR
jgi:hypothetical protein